VIVDALGQPRRSLGAIGNTQDVRRGVAAPYFSHSVYTDASFEFLQKFLFEHFHDHWVVYARDPNRDWEILRDPSVINVHNGDDKTETWPSASLVAAPARSIADDYGLVTFTARDMRWANERGLLSYLDYPLRLRARFAQCPNVMIINSSRRWYQLQMGVSEEIVESLRAAGHEVHVHSFEDDMVDQIRNAYPDPADAFDEIHGLVQRALRGTEVPVSPAQPLPPDCVEVAPEFHPDAWTALRTAETLTGLLRGNIDCSAGVVEYCKTVEIELDDKLLGPLRHEWSARTPPSQLTGRGDLQRLYNHIFRQKHIELGTLAYALGAALDARYDGDPVAESVRQLLSKYPDPDFARRELASRVAALAALLRNPASHRTVLTPKDLADCRQIVVGGNGQRGLLPLMLQPPLQG
jgi:hypothetical protein